MSEINLNLANLSAEEILQINSVLFRNKKLEENEKTRNKKMRVESYSLIISDT
jgi:hypothetical protein